MLNKIQLQLIETIKSRQLITSNLLADCLMCSKRSVITYIQDINKIYPSLIISSRKGYFLNGQKYYQIEKEFATQQQSSPDERFYTIIKAFFLSNNDSVSINDLSYDLYVSDSTIRADMYRIKEMLPDKDLDIILSEGKASLTGPEKARRNYYHIIISRMRKESFFESDVLQEFFPDIDLKPLRRKIRDVLREEGIAINDFSSTSLIQHVLIVLNRNRRNHILTSINTPRFVRENDIECARRVADIMEKDCQLKICEAEIINLATLLSAHYSNLPAKDATMDNLKSILWPSLYTMFVEIIEHLKEVCRINLTKKPENCVGLALHIRNLIHRGSINMYTETPYASSMKTVYIFPYECACYIAKKIHDYFQLTIAESEIAFIGIYIANNIAINQNPRSKLSVLFLMSENSVVFRELYDYYSKVFENDIHSSLTSTPDSHLLQEADLIITVDDMPAILPNAHILQIMPFICDADYTRISNTVRTLKEDKKKAFRKRSLLASLESGNIQFSIRCDNIYNMLTVLTAKLQDKILINDDFFFDLLLRASLSSVVINNIAILRNCDFLSLANTTSFLTLEHPMDFLGEKIEAVFLLTSSDSHYLTYINSLEYLVAQTSDRKIARSIIRSANFDELVSALTV